MRLRFRVRTLLIGCALLAVYLGAYRSLLNPVHVLEESAGGIGFGYRGPDFLLGGRLAKLAFWPAIAVDRYLRPAYWNEYSTADDVRTQTEYSWGYIEYVNGQATCGHIMYPETRADVHNALAELRKHRDVTGLRIQGPGFTDADLANLPDLRTFHWLDLFLTSVTREGATEFIRSHPQTSVTYIPSDR